MHRKQKMKSKEVLKLLGVTRVTLCKYVKEGTIKVDSVNNGRYVYNDESVYRFIGMKRKNKPSL